MSWGTGKGGDPRRLSRAAQTCLCFATTATAFVYPPMYCVCKLLDTEAAGLPLATSLLELATLVLVVDAHVGLLARARCARRLAEVLVHLTGFEGATEEHAPRARGSTERKLVKGDDLAAGGRDAGAGVVSSAEAAHGELEHACTKTLQSQCRSRLVVDFTSCIKSRCRK